MPVGILLSDNVTFSVETYVASQDASGGTSETYTAVGTGLTGLFTQVSGQREGDFHGESERGRAVISSESAYLDSGNARVKITATVDASLSWMVNTYWRIEQCGGHPAGRGGLRKARYTASLSRLEPAR